MDGGLDGEDGERNAEGGELISDVGVGGASGVVVGNIFPAILQNSSKLSNIRST